jgi:NitT/TauT family transport system substrate-binding protein
MTVKMPTRRDLLCGTVAALGAAAIPARGRAATLAPIRVALVVSDSSALCEYARVGGFLDKSGMTVDIQYLANGGASLPALLGGTIDITPSNSLSALIAQEKGLPLKIIAMEAIYRSGQASTLMLVNRDSPLQTARDLEGKTVAISTLLSNTHIAVMRWIDKNGGNSKAVKYIELGFSAMPAALEAKRVDAIMVAEPNIAASMSFARVFADAYGSYAPTWLQDCFVSTDAWIAAHPAETKAFCAAMLATAAWANRNHDKTAPILAKALKMDEHVVDTMRRAVFAEKVTPALLGPVVDAGLAYGALTKPISPADAFSRQVL